MVHEIIVTFPPVFDIPLTWNLTNTIGTHADWGALTELANNTVLPVTYTICSQRSRVTPSVLSQEVLYFTVKS